MSRQAKPVVSLNLSSLDEGLNHLTQQVTPAALELEWPGTEFAPSFELGFDVLRMGDNLQVDGRFRGGLQTSCDRCLEEFELELRGTFRVLGRRGDPKTHELADQDGVVFHAGHDLDLTDEIREAILLALPMQTVCSEDCRGLCPRCGANRNQGDCDCEQQVVDPRWAALGQLKGDQASS